VSGWRAAGSGCPGRSAQNVRQKSEDHLEIIAELLDEFDSGQPHFHATEIFNESWLIKAVLHRASTLNDRQRPLSFAEGATWFSEAYLPTAFAPRHRGDKLSEARTHADGVIGHFSVGDNAKGDLHVKRDARQFKVVEAKIHSPLSSGVSNAVGYDQAARNVACIAESLSRAKLPVSRLDDLSFIVLAPAEAIQSGTFSNLVTTESIGRKVRERVASYEGALDQWLQDWFEPTLDAIRLHVLSWEDALAWIGQSDPEAERVLWAFYEKCLLYN
jgi:hypothetical protein